MSLQSIREFVVKDKALSASGKKKILNPHNNAEIGFFKSRALQWKKKFRLTDMDNRTLLVIVEKGFRFRSTFKFYQGTFESNFKKGSYLGKLKKKIAFRMRFWFQDPQGNTKYNFDGDFRAKNYTITDENGMCAEISKKFFALRDTYGIKVSPSIGDNETMLLLSLVAALDTILDRRGR